MSVFRVGLPGRVTVSAFFHGNVTPEHHQPPMQSSGCNLFGRLPGEHGTLSTMPCRNHGQPYHVGRPGSMGIRHRNNTRHHITPPHRQNFRTLPRFTANTATTSATATATRQQRPKKAPTRAFLMWGLLSIQLLFSRFRRRFFRPVLL